MTARILTSDDLTEWREALSAASYVAIDTEFHAERAYLPRLYLVQVHIPGSGTWVLDPLQRKSFAEAAPALKGVPVWLLHAGFQDLRILQGPVGGLPEHIWDTQVAAGMLRPDYPASLKTLVDDMLGIELDKSNTLSDWSRRPLKPSQLTYAAEDVVHLPALWNRLREALERLGRYEQALQASAELARRAVDPDALPPHLRYRHMLNRMTPVEAQAAIELATWRESMAQERNQPVRSIMGDAVLRQIARLLPRDKATLASNRRMPKGLVNRHSDEVIAAVGRALALEEADLPPVHQRGDTQDLALAGLQLAAQLIGQQIGASARLLLPVELAEELVMSPPDSLQALEQVLGPWRASLLAASLWEVLQGRRAMFLYPSVTDATLAADLRA